MSVEATTAVLNRTMSDESFLDRVRDDPEGALEEYDLTDDERAALASGDESRLREHLGEISLKTAVVVIVI